MESTIVVRVEKNEKIFITFLEDTCITATLNHVIKEGDYLVVEKKEGHYYIESYQRREYLDAIPKWFDTFRNDFRGSIHNITSIEFSGLSPFKEFFSHFEKECPSIKVLYTKAEL